MDKIGLNLLIVLHKATEKRHLHSFDFQGFPFPGYLMKQALEFDVPEF